MRDSVPSARYSPICNVLRQWKTSLIWQAVCNKNKIMTLRTYSLRYVRNFVTKTLCNNFVYNKNPAVPPYESAARQPAPPRWMESFDYIFIYYLFLLFSLVLFSVFYCILRIALYSLYCSVFSVLYCFHCIVLHSLFCTVFTVLHCIHCIVLYSL